MPSVTLAESAKLSQDLLVSGVIENVITVNQFFQVLPFQPIEGNALAYNRENALGDVQFAGVGSTITAKAPATFTADPFLSMKSDVTPLTFVLTSSTFLVIFAKLSSGLLMSSSVRVDSVINGEVSSVKT
jgi:hypothetical protein